MSSSEPKNREREGDEGDEGEEQNGEDEEKTSTAVDEDDEDDEFVSVNEDEDVVVVVIIIVGGGVGETSLGVVVLAEFGCIFWFGLLGGKSRKERVGLEIKCFFSPVFFLNFFF